MTTEDHHEARSIKDHSFDELAKGLAEGSVSRRQALRWIGAALLGGALGSIPGIAFGQPGPPEGTGKVPGGSQGCPYPGQIRVLGGRCECPSGQVLCNNACVNGPFFCGENEHFNSTTCRCECPEAMCGDMCCPPDAPCCGGATCCPSTQVCCGDTCCAVDEECDEFGQCVPSNFPLCSELPSHGVTCEDLFPGYPNCCEAEHAIFCCGPEVPVGQCGSSVSGCQPVVSG